MDIGEILTIGDSAIQRQVVVDGSVRCSDFHPGMSGTATWGGAGFIEDATLLGSSESVVRTTQVTQFGAGLRLTCDFTDLGFYNSPDYGGATVTHADGLYNKVYFSPVRNSSQLITSAGWFFTRTFG